MTSARSATEWSTWGAHARIVVTDPDALSSASNLIRGYLAAADAAVNRDRADAEIRSLDEGPNTVTPMFARFLTDALAAARTTEGALDPTASAPAPQSWRSITVDGTEVTLPAGVELDLTATARASSADHCASTTAELLGCGVLVALGGDIATAGTTPPGGWQVQVQDLPGDPTCQVSIPSGAAVATASTVKPLHPDSISLWRTVTVVAESCTTAHASSTAAVGMGGGAIDWLTNLELPARLVDQEFRVITLGGWPS
ncbi:MULTISPECIES: FAD:protein FMN transferase [Rhodococcus]|uniref:FAD:protein FMN transferase n=1 Tax=Rhodococcus opacus TaxID=37919 RepID=A0AAX3YLY8_RHOOP|nr:MULTISPECIES: FAD:protein FMN transferase [Rhodococcus]ELB89640.1 membrane-associated lipoprotein [Rhodococcus wratislaviensis IFP 2016]NHU41501.1 hypothetical protein [Rhodococcus sp. A14]MCZ4582303.1 FAD:protein FMN transferase [Rhodococcus opacus]MDI9934024.1 FAD:protein FMN transferase [Rhodococcus sp. IEGM 1351]QZS55044.1 FAD:protein FMN transferase [Rhodococcus opacus]